MENERLKVKFREVSGVYKDLGRYDHWEASYETEKKTDKPKSYSVRSAIHEASRITKMIEIEEK